MHPLHADGQRAVLLAAPGGQVARDDDVALSARHHVLLVTAHLDRRALARGDEAVARPKQQRDWPLAARRHGALTAAAPAAPAAPATTAATTSAAAAASTDHGALGVGVGGAPELAPAPILAEGRNPPPRPLLGSGGGRLAERALLVALFAAERSQRSLKAQLLA